MPPPWQGARKPHAKNDVTMLRKCVAKRDPCVNSALAELRFFSRCVCHGLSVNYPPGVNRTQAGRDSAFANSMDESRFEQE